MVELTPHEFFTALRKEDSQVIKAIYKLYFPPVRNFINMNSGNDYDAQDVFQDAMVVLFMKVRSKIPHITSTIGTYIYSICKYLWYKELRKRNKIIPGIFDPDEFSDMENNFLKDFIRMEKRKLVLDHFKEMPGECQQILSLFVNETPIAKITRIMGYRSDQYTRNRRLMCKEKLIRRIWNSPRYKELRNEAYRENTKVPRW